MIVATGTTSFINTTLPGGLRLTATLSALCLLAGCVTTGGPGAGGATVNYISALQGGIAGRSGVKLERNNMQRALEAEYRALEAAPGGQPVVWAGSGARGEVVAAAPYQVGNENCRQYTHKLSSGGKDTVVRGAACRNTDGTWTPLT